MTKRIVSKERKKRAYGKQNDKHVTIVTTTKTISLIYSCCCSRRWNETYDNLVIGQEFADTRILVTNNGYEMKMRERNPRTNPSTSHAYRIRTMRVSLVLEREFQQQ